MSTSVLVRGHCVSGKSRVPTNDATSSYRLHSIERVVATALVRLSVMLLDQFITQL